MFYFVFCVVVVLSTFGLSSFFHRGVVRRLVAAFYLCGVIQTNKTDLIS